jgi:purine-nucleoside phosphorylase
MSSATSHSVPAVAETRQHLQESVQFIATKTALKPRVGIILGSGLGELADATERAVRLPYGDIPHFPLATAPLHKGQLVLGHLAGQDVVLMQGRFHTYEGYTAQQVSYPVRVMKALGIETLIVTCAAGGLNPKFHTGDLMVIVDHLNMTGTNPLIGPNDPNSGDRFPVMFDAYRPELIALAHHVALENGLRLQEGIYAGVTGPAFFTKAELRFLTRIGADALGMSTVGEVITAAHAGLKVLGLAAISDMAIPDAGRHATETEILNVMAHASLKLGAVVKGVLAAL